MDHNAPLPLANETVQPVPGLTLTWQQEHRLIYVKFANMARETVDAWINTVSPIMHDWPREQPYVIIYDATDPRVSLTPYVQTRLKELSKVSDGLQGRVSLILPRNFVAQIVQLYMRTQAHNSLQTRIFFDVEEGTRWAAHYLESNAGKVAGP